MIFFLGGSMLLVLVLILVFFILGKSEIFNSYQSSIFECGFLSYFFCRYSFSIHYFIVGLIFLFLDLELCFIFPFLVSEINSFSLSITIYFFLFVLLMGLIEEWRQGKLDWVSWA